MKCPIVLIVVCIVLFGCCPTSQITELPEFKFKEGDIVKHKVLGFTAQVIGNTYYDRQSHRRDRNNCIIVIYPPLSPEAIEFIKGGDGGYRRKVERTQMKEVIARECEFELKED